MAKKKKRRERQTIETLMACQKVREVVTPIMAAVREATSLSALWE